MQMLTIDSAATVLYNAEANRTEIDPLSDSWRTLDVETAYRVQQELVTRKVKAGEHIIGVKLGLTSEAKQKRMGISSPLTAVITDAMQMREGASVPYDALIHPRVEPEIVFVLARDLKGPNVDLASALAAVGTVHAGLEIIDSRYRNFRFLLPDVVADNASSSYFAVSSQAHRADDLDLAAEEVVLSVDGVEVGRATGAAVQGHPAAALALAANSLHERGQYIPAGSLVLTGGLTDAVEISPGSSVTATFTSLGVIELPADLKS